VVTALLSKPYTSPHIGGPLDRLQPDLDSEIDPSAQSSLTGHSHRHQLEEQRSLDPPRVDEPITRFNYLAAHAAAMRDPAREAYARSLRGKYAGLIPTTDDYLREKHEELRREEE